MINNYEASELFEIGKAQEVILGDPKLVPIVDDSPGEGLRHFDPTQDDE